MQSADFCCGCREIETIHNPLVKSPFNGHATPWCDYSGWFRLLYNKCGWLARWLAGCSLTFATEWNKSSVSTGGRTIATPSKMQCDSDGLRIEHFHLFDDGAALTMGNGGAGSAYKWFTTLCISIAPSHEAHTLQNDLPPPQNTS